MQLVEGRTARNPIVASLIQLVAGQDAQEHHGCLPDAVEGATLAKDPVSASQKQLVSPKFSLYSPT